MKMRSADHVVYDFGSPRRTLTVFADQQMPLLCTHCGEEFIVKLPMSLRMATAIMRQYAREHRRCRVYGPRLPGS